MNCYSTITIAYNIQLQKAVFNDNIYNIYIYSTTFITLSSTIPSIDQYYIKKMIVPYFWEMTYLHAYSCYVFDWSLCLMVSQSSLLF